MFTPASHDSFIDRDSHRLRTRASLLIALIVLGLNSGLGIPELSFGLGLLGSLLILFAYWQGSAKLELAHGWVALTVGLVVLTWAVLGVGRDTALSFGSRIFCGMTWVLWLGTRVDWSSLRQLLLDIHVPAGLVSTLDRSLLHGFLTKSEWLRRRDAARVRGGQASLSTSTWTSLLTEGAMGSFNRLEKVEEQTRLRASAVGSTERPPRIELRNLSVAHDKDIILKDMHLALSGGEFIALCGASGAGKSTLLRLLAGLETPAHGQMTRLGREITPRSPLTERLDGRIALLTQNPEHHFLASSVSEDIAWGLRQRGAEESTIEASIEKVATPLGIRQLLSRACHRLSFGEQRRVALAGLLVLEPSLLLLDEPTAGLDPVAAHELIQLVQTITKKQGTTCVWATHDLTQLPERIQRIILLRHGEILFDGPLKDGLTQPQLVDAGLAIKEETTKVSSI
ncbi:MAG: energy-coupling factor ABC transporter ATP-binding protein [Polyangiaceae bacterium]|nr:energy-coupling factor ABC transporter ATP-binding protein [Polyangiaceae bacterium]